MRVTAVVVTFNRLTLLQMLIDRLTSLPQLAQILVIDNASTDGTGAWLAASTPERVTGRTLRANTGGAGGFNEGVRSAVEETDAELVWLMDDDGLPDEDCLEQLMAFAGHLDFWGPVVVDESAPERLVFPIRLPGGTRVVHEMADVRKAARALSADAPPQPVIADVVIPFNGILLTRELIEKIGLPRAEYFIWGDDHEYRMRAEQAGARIATVVDARVAHPSVGELGTPMMFGATTYNHSPSELKHYCMARNNLLNLREYKGWPHALAFVAKTAWFYAFTRPQAARLVTSARAMVAGLRGDFTGHRRYL